MMTEIVTASTGLLLPGNLWLLLRLFRSQWKALASSSGRSNLSSEVLQRLPHPLSAQKDYPPGLALRACPDPR